MQNLLSKNITNKIMLSGVLGIIGFVLFLILYLLENIQFDIALTDSITTTIIFVLIVFSLWYPANYMKVENYSILNLVLNNFIITIITSLLWL
nr:hypothetical protein [Melioribacteraceae bacterium]